MVNNYVLYCSHNTYNLNQNGDEQHRQRAAGSSQ